MKAIFPMQAVFSNASNFSMEMIFFNEQFFNARIFFQ
jgi:hypothetical protein